VTEDFVLTEIARQLSGLAGDWSVADGRVRGPGDTAVVIGQQHQADSPNHVDIGFVVDVTQDPPTVIWDCVTGIGGDTESALSRAVTTWTQTTAATIIEMFTQRQQFAAHLGPDDAEGLPGHHVILGPVLAYGRGEPEALQHWAVGNVLPAAFAETLVPQLDQGLNGVKVFFGGVRGEEVAEVRINGVASAEVSRTLLAMDWPRLPEPAFARLFMLVHKV
jgi:hypothetical protein